MSLEQEIGIARKEIISRGYDMSVGEVMCLYRDKELVINPAFQRLFRWNESQKTRFIESLLIGIPIPPIFVMQDESGVWELIDGLQRLSTILEFTELLHKEGDEPIQPPILEGTTYLPSLSGKRWEPSNADESDGIGKIQQMQMKRARMRVEILTKESYPTAKYQLFQRLNTCGAPLTSQEVRNCIAEMINPEFRIWLAEQSRNFNFVKTTCQTEQALKQQMGVELVLRFLTFRRIPYEPGVDVNEYLDSALNALASDAKYPRKTEQTVFELTFEWLFAALGDSAFKNWNTQANTFTGDFLMPAFEVIAVGISHNIDGLQAMDSQARSSFIRERATTLADNPMFMTHAHADVRETTRLANLLPMGKDFFRP